MDLQLSEFRIELSYFLLELKGFLIPKMEEKKYLVSAAKVFAFWREKNGFMFRKVSFSIFNDFFTIVAVMEIEFRDCLETDRNDKSKYTWERDGNSVWKWFFFYFIDFHWRSASFGRQNKQKKRWSNEMFESNKKEKKKLKLTIERDVFASIVFVCAKQIVFDSIIDFQFTFFFSIRDESENTSQRASMTTQTNRRKVFSLVQLLFNPDKNIMSKWFWHFGLKWTIENVQQARARTREIMWALQTFYFIPHFNEITWNITKK